MRQKSHKKHTAKKPPADLFPSAVGTAPLTALATAAQLFPYTGLDEDALRRREREINPHANPPAPWIPKARGARWPTGPTIAGCCAWHQHQLTLADTRALPRQCASMKDAEAIYHIPLAMLQFIRGKGLAPDAFDASNRVNILPILRAASPFLAKLFGGNSAQLAAITGFEDLDLDTARIRCLQQDEIEKRRENALAAHDLNTRDGIERELAEPLALVFTALKHYEKTTGGKLKSLLASAGVAPEIVKQTIATATAGIQEPLSKLRDQFQFESEQQQIK